MFNLCCSCRLSATVCLPHISQTMFDTRLHPRTIPILVDWLHEFASQARFSTEHVCNQSNFCWLAQRDFQSSTVLSWTCVQPVHPTWLVSSAHTWFGKPWRKLIKLFNVMSQNAFCLWLEQSVQCIKKSKTCTLDCISSAVSLSLLIFILQNSFPKRLC